ncbi:MAG: TetR/AcrR family transcriptional regulator [Pseudomonadota bacterium]
MRQRWSATIRFKKKETPMPRPLGSRNEGFEVKRQELVEALTEHALNADIRRPSLREFAQSCGVSEPTLRHYFEDRRGTVLAILEEIARRGQAIWDAVATPSPGGEAALDAYFMISSLGIQNGGFVRAHAFGIIEGLADLEIGKAYVRLILEPSLQSLMTKLKLSSDRAMPEAELRAVALAAFSPLLLVSLHQDLLGGKDSAVIDPAALMDALKAHLSPAL